MSKNRGVWFVILQFKITKFAIYVDIRKHLIPTFQVNIHSIQNYKMRNLNPCNLVFLNNKDS